MKYLFTIALSLLLAISALAQTETLQVDITKLSQQELLAYQQMKQKQANAGLSLDNLTPENINKYAQMGEGLGIAINKGLGAVTQNVEEFAQTSAGKWLMIIITWKVMGQDGLNLIEKTIQYAIGFPLIFIGTIFFIYMFRRNCIARPALVSKTKVGWLTVKSEYKGTTTPVHAGEAMILYGIAYAAFIGLCCAIIFPG